MSCSSSAIHGTSTTTTTTTSSTTTTTETDPKKFKGVRRRKWGKWVSEIRVPRTAERLWLGTYATPEAAAVAHDVAVYCLRRPSSLEKLNFPETLSSYCCVQPQMRGDMSPRSVQKVASDAGMAVDAHNIAAAAAGKTLSSSSSSSSMVTAQTTPYDQKENNSDDDRRRHSNNNGVAPDHSHDAFWWEGLRYGCGATWQGSEDCREGEDLSISVEDYL